MPTERKALLAQTGQALGAAEAFLAAARARLVARVAPAGRVEPERFDADQLAGHGLAWMAGYVEALRQMRSWAARLDEAARFGDIEALILEIVYGEYLAQLAGGIPMSQGEFARAQDLGLADENMALLRAGEAGSLSAGGAAARLRLGARLAEAGEGAFGDPGIDDAALGLIRDQVRRFAEHEVAPYAQEWHRRDELIPLPVIEALGRMGVFGMTIPEEHGGLGLGKTAMSIVSE
ncbi:MAG: acyl-CoA dehydrogenase family protein, partial [Alphaproteobacteria bacterium]|nr:acyl-CoA dehydrogenase family protein [Alphaproteobacteria bacterium]